MQAFLPTQSKCSENGWIELVSCWNTLLIRTDGQTAAHRADRTEALARIFIRFLEQSPHRPDQCPHAIDAQMCRLLTYWPTEEACHLLRERWMSCLARHALPLTVVDMIGTPYSECYECSSATIEGLQTETRAVRVA